MIERGDYNYELKCDFCNSIADETFDTFQEAVDYKKDRENNWRSVRSASGEWYDLCPDCNDVDTIAKVKEY
jgi:hypothetical protein